MVLLLLLLLLFCFVVFSLKVEQIPDKEGNECKTEECYLSRCQQQTPQGRQEA